MASHIFSIRPSPNSLELISPAPAKGGALALRMGEPLLSPLALVLREWMLLNSPSSLQEVVTSCPSPSGGKEGAEIVRQELAPQQS